MFTYIYTVSGHDSRMQCVKTSIYMSVTYMYVTTTAADAAYSSCRSPHTAVVMSQHTSAYASIRQHTAAAAALIRQ